jgi:2-C-methyl-D-erythritol 4-phosphate cytidylyltransferase
MVSNNNVIIVAGGSGSRMNQALPKQFTLIHNIPVLIHTIRAFLSFDPNIHLVLVLPESHLSLWQKIQIEFLPNQKVSIAFGGATRFQSVRNGLAGVAGGLVAIHDAVRPCVSVASIEASFESAARLGSGVLSVPMKDSLRELSENTSRSVDRAKFHIVQTPQTFQVSLIKRAFEVEEQPFFTDDASVYEYALDEPVSLVPGDYKNIKITTQEDLEVISLFLAAK